MISTLILQQFSHHIKTAAKSQYALKVPSSMGNKNNTTNFARFTGSTGRVPTTGQQPNPAATSMLPLGRTGSSASANPLPKPAR